MNFSISNENVKLFLSLDALIGVANRVDNQMLIKVCREHKANMKCGYPCKKSI